MIRPVTLGLLTALVLAAPAAASAAPERAAPTQLAPAPVAPIAAARPDASGYAQREQRDPEVAKYEGGSMIVIGISGSALVVLLLILLLI
jgi:hypothetical protein